MLLLIVGLSLFIAIHCVPMFASQRAAMIAKIGVLPYKIVFSVIALVGLVAIVKGKAIAPYIEIWQPPVMFSALTKILMLPAFIFLVATYIPCNIKQKLGHPMVIGVKTWALAHLLSNGDLASIILFGSLLAWAVASMISAKRRQAGIEPSEGKPVYMDIAVLVVGGLLYAGVGMHHYQLFGVPIF